MIRKKKEAIAESELALKKAEHDLGTLAKERTAAGHFVANLEKMYEWIGEEQQ